MRGFPTLHVTAVGMIALALFDGLLMCLRTYLFAHTSNRIDFGLGHLTHFFVMSSRCLGLLLKRRRVEVIARVRRARADPPFRRAIP